MMLEKIPEQDNDQLAIEIKRLRFRSWHRGTREMDLILGRFADSHLANMSEPEIADFDTLLQHPDADIMDWITGRKAAAEDVSPELMLKLKKACQMANAD